MKKRIRRYMRDGHRRSFFRRFVSILACVVVFCTTYALLLPAITLEKTAACGIEEHQHDDSCYENKLTCGLKETEGHSHTEDCYDIHSQIICKIEEHAHTGDCFDKNGNLTCALEEHTHDIGCFREDRVLSCKKEEAEPHHHSDACYEKVLTCLKEIHTHSAACYPEKGEAEVSVSEEADVYSTEEAESPALEEDNPALEEAEFPESEKAAASLHFQQMLTDATSLYTLSGGTFAGETLVGNTSPEDNSSEDTPPGETLSGDTTTENELPEEREETETDEAVWIRVDENDIAEVHAADTVRLYYAYTIPAGKLDASNAEFRFPLPSNVYLTDEQIETNNSMNDGRGTQALEGTRTPDEAPSDPEDISAWVTFENVYDDFDDDTYEDIEAKSLSLLKQDVVLTFDEYSIEKNRKTYDNDGALISDGEKINGFFSIDVTADQIQFDQNDENLEAQITLVEKDSELDIEPICRTLRLVEEDETEEKVSEEEGLEEKEPEEEEAEGEKTEEETISEAGNDLEEASEAEERSNLEEETEEETGENLKGVTEEETESDSEKEQGAEADSNSEDETEAEAGEDSEKAPEAGTLTFEGPDYTVSVTYTEDAGIPEGASLVVSEIREGSDEYNTYRTQAEDAIAAGGLSWIRLFDISIEVDGKPIEPNAPVAVQINCKEAIAQEQNTEVNTVHFEGTKETPKILDTEVEGTENTTEQVSFETDGFSVFAIVGTVIEKTVLASDGKNYHITATYGVETGIPMDADLAVEEILPVDSDDASTSSVYDEYVSKTENVLGMEDGGVGYIRLFDISIVNKDNPNIKYQPVVDTTVDMCVELEDKDSSIEASTSTQVVHFTDGSKDGDIIESSTEGQIISFEADGFSIYAIVDSSKRLQYNFYDGTNLLVSEYIKKHDNVLQELYDPGVEPEYGQTFVGWAYTPNETNPSNIYTIEQLNQQAADRYNSATEELTEINVYAIYDEAWYLRYMDQDEDGNATVLYVVRVRKDAVDKNVSIDYTFTPEEGIVFEGWTDVATGQTYHQGNTITLDHHVDLYVKLQGRNWLVFDSNAGGPGSNATYTPPQLLIGTEATTVKPDDPTRRGYAFTGWNTKADGTGTWWYKADGSENRFGYTLDEDTTLYAQWEAAPQNYYVVFWRQKSSDEAGLPDSEKTYQYIGTETRNSTTGSIVSLEDSDKNRNTGDFVNCSFNTALSENGSVTVNADGTTTLNVFYDLNSYVLTFEVTGGSGTRYRYDPVGTDNGTSTVYGFINGEWKQLTRSSSQNTVWYFKYVYTAYNWGDYRIYEPTHTYTSRNNVSSGQRYNRSNYTSSNTYTGTRYTRSGSGYTNYIYSETTGTEENQFGVDNNGAFVELGKATETIYSYTYDNNGTPVAYNGPIYTRTTVNNSTTKWTYKTISALYGHSIADQFPITYNESSRWLDTNSTYYSSDYVLVSIDKMPPANIVFTWSSASGKKTRIMNYYVEGLEGNEDGYSYNGYTSDSLYAGTEREKRYKGYDTVLYNQIIAQYNFVTRDEDYIDIEGFTKWETDPAFNANGIALNNNNNVDTINMYYKRNKYTINYISKGSHVTAQSIKNDDKVFFESSLADYGKNSDGAWYYEPTNGNEGYFFAGWYLDEECTQTFDFANEKMPSHDITVYAKWDTYRVRVVLVPTPNNEHNDEVELANNQSLSFRMDYNEEVSDANISSSVAKRAGYKLIGWYYTPNFDPSTEIHFPIVVNKDTPGVDMNYQSGEDWNKYGDNDGNHDNVRGILKLYAKWELDVDENSVYVEYDVDDVYRTYDTAGMLQTTIPVDDTKYALTNNKVTFQVAEAPTKYTSGFEFYRWVLLNPDGSESDIMYNPSDTASEIPSSFIYEETITDDLGNTATIKKIRLKAKFNIETEKVTTVTFDGNGGVTNDSAKQESVTESYPINKEFFMKDVDSFVREGYTLLGWAFEREDGSKITPEAFKQAIAGMSADQLIQAGIYQLGQKVAADNLEVSGENNWNPLGNTVYAVWERNTYTVTVKKIVDGETATDKEFTFSASASGDYTIPTGYASFKLVNGSDKAFAEVPYGTILTFSETAASGYSIQSVVAKQTTLPDKTPLEEADYIDLDGADGKSYTIKGDTVITYTNEKAEKQKLRIHKIGDDAASGLAGAKFDLTATGVDGFANMTGITSLDVTTVSENLGYLPGNDGSDTTLFLLPAGTYTLSETSAPTYYDGLLSNVTLTVTAEGITMSKNNNNDTVELSEPDDGVYTLTVTNTRKKATVKVVKNVVGTDADKEENYSFSQTGLTGEQTFNLRGSDNESTVDTVENEKVFANVPYGTVFCITEADTYTDFDTTIAISNENPTVTTSRLTTGNVTVDSDVVTITYTNTRNKQPIKVFKYETGTTPENPLADAVFSLTGPEGTGISYTGLTTNADGYLENGEGIIFKLPVNDGAYTLTETQAPDGYLIIGDGITTFTVTTTGVEGGGIPEMQTINEEEVPTGVYIIKVQNSAGYVLPSTGGSGTNLIYLLGIILTGLAGLGLVIRRRRKAT